MKKCAKANNFLSSCGGHAEKENGLHDLIEIMLESMMVAERGEYLRGIDDGNKGNEQRKTTQLMKMWFVLFMV